MENEEVLWNSYIEPGTKDVLVNLLGIKNDDMLREVEATYSSKRLLELEKDFPNMGFGKEHLNYLHNYIFQDIYPFAGKYRKVNMQKLQGFFVRCDKIDETLDIIFKEVYERLGKCTSKIDFCQTLAYLYTMLIHCHPYREGNGRVTREFLREFSIVKSKEIGLSEMELDWRLIDRKELNKYLEVDYMISGNIAMLFYSALVERRIK